MDIERGKKYALNLLGMRDYTCSEVFEHLERKGVLSQDAEKIVADLIRLGLLDDRKYAKMYIYDGAKIGGKGIYRLKQELYKKGVAQNIIEEAIADTEVSFLDAAVEYTRYKYGEDLSLSFKEISRLKAHLARKGYSYSEITECLEILNIKCQRGD